MRRNNKFDDNAIMIYTDNMKYRKIVEGIFRKRPNRFIAHVEIEGVEHVVHVKNTGRCKELLVPGAKVWLEESDNPARKTRYDLVAVYKESHGEIPGQIINMDSQAPNMVAKEWLQAGGMGELTVLRPESVFGQSRVDFYLETIDGRRILLEVKGVTLEHDGIASFPDAPTERGVKHLKELASAKEQGFEAAILFVIQMKHIQYMKPNRITHPQFGEALQEAASRGVKVMAYDCLVTPEGLAIDQPVEVRIGE